MHVQIEGVFSLGWSPCFPAILPVAVDGLALLPAGFEYVFDANFSADLTIMEEGTELLKRLRKKWGLELPAEPGGQTKVVS